MADTDIELYLHEICGYPLLNEEEEHSLALSLRAGDNAAREKMICCNLRLVVSIAKYYSGNGLSLLDLIAEGNLGLIKAVARFDPNAGSRFSTYATWWIKQAIRRALTAKAKSIRVPAYLAEIINRWRAKAHELRQRAHREPTPEEIADELSIPLDRIESIRRAMSAVNAVSYSGTNDNWIDASAESMDEMVASNSSRSNEDVGAEKLRAIFSCLDERSREILEMRYGLKNGNTETLEKIGRTLQPPITRERVRQIETAALKKLLRILSEFG